VQYKQAIFFILRTAAIQHPFNGRLSGTTQVSWYQKGNTNLDLLEQETVSGSGLMGHMQVCTSPQTHNHASIPTLNSLQAGCPSCCPTNSIKALKASSKYKKHKITSDD